MALSLGYVCVCVGPRVNSVHDLLLSFEQGEKFCSEGVSRRVDKTEEKSTANGQLI